jgi:hypothetical protein
MSKFTKELKDGGLRKIADNISNPGYNVYKDANGDVVFKTIHGGGVGTTRLNNIVVWEHDTMDWYQAEALVKEFYTDAGFKGRRGCNPFLSDRLFPIYNTNNYEDVYDVYISGVDTADQKYKDLVQSYINKKLNWSPNV